jgi:hypothetical protein
VYVHHSLGGQLSVIVRRGRLISRCWTRLLKVVRWKRFARCSRAALTPDGNSVTGHHLSEAITNCWLYVGARAWD